MIIKIFLLLLLTFILCAIICRLIKLKIKYKNKDIKDTITFGRVYSTYKDNLYLDECRKSKYKFSVQVLEKLMKKEGTKYILENLDINDMEEAKKIKGVGYKVYSLMEHLIQRYKEDLIMIHNLIDNNYF